MEKFSFWDQRTCHGNVMEIFLLLDCAFGGRRLDLELERFQKEEVSL